MQPRAGCHEGKLSHLTEIIFVQAVHIWIASQPMGQGEWLGALCEPQIGAALTLIHHAPEQPWSVAAMAREVAMSGSPFAARFTALVGEPPLTYLTRWRLHLPTSLLRDGRLPESAVAERGGYASAAAFSKAFKCRFGAAPAHYSHRQRLAIAHSRSCLEPHALLLAGPCVTDTGLHSIGYQGGQHFRATLNAHYGAGSTSVTLVTRSKCLVIFATCSGALQA